MPALIFPDFETYSNSVQGIDGEMRVTGRGDGAWLMNTLELGDATLLHGVDGAPVLYRGALHAAHFGVYLALPGSQTQLDGQPQGEDCFTWLAPRMELHGFTRVPASFLAIDLREQLVLDHAAQIEGLEVPRLYRTGTITTTAAMVGHVTALVQRAFDVRERQPDAFAAAGPRQAYAAQLAAAVLQCHRRAAGEPGAARRGRPPLPRREIVSRGVQHIQRSLRGEAAFSDIAFAVGVSQRSLNRAFDDLYGMAPHHFYLIERLHAIRGELRSPQAGDTVTSICSRFGVWDLGRMAAQYARMFHVQPAQELARALGERSGGTPGRPARRR